ncbi:MAG: type II toxin-antitoxin system VapC family toxin [Symploca sp. SIO2E6]|nr:type II toxin-antitoxin system VapC family toxin [Symploca sp. SIO2E6]
MSGSKFLLDTNFVIGLLKGNEQVVKYLMEHSIKISECAYSFISRIELLSYSNITNSEIVEITTLLNAMQYLAMTPAIENTTITIRRQYTLKVPDAIIAAMALEKNLELLTLDRKLANRMKEILTQANNIS